MINLLFIGFGDTTRNNSLMYELEKLDAKIYYYDFFNFKDRKEYYNLKEPISGLILGGASTIRNGNQDFADLTKKDKSSLLYLIEHEHSLYKEIMNIPKRYQNVPILVICYGQQILNKYYGGSLPERLKKKSVGKKETNLIQSGLFMNMPKKIWPDYNHYFYTLTGAPHSKIIAYTNNIITGYEYNNIHFGIQFHIIKSDPKVERILSNFYKICLEYPFIQRNNKLLFGVTGILLFIYAINNRLKK